MLGSVGTFTALAAYNAPSLCRKRAGRSRNAIPSRFASGSESNALRPDPCGRGSERPKWEERSVAGLRFPD
jgi:hypothetical protein